MSDDVNRAVSVEELSRRMVDAMTEMNFSSGDGSACLAIAYARWIELQAGATEEVLDRLLKISRRTTIEAFRILRGCREEGDRRVRALQVNPQ